MKHYSVLLKECIENLAVKPDGIYVDGTLGRAGHASHVAALLDQGKLIGFDKDETALTESKEVLAPYASKVVLVRDDFCHLKDRLKELGIEKVDGILLDLGVSSPQFDDAQRGFSYRFDARLDMRMDQSQELSAYEVVNNYSYEQLVSILYRYGEEKFAKQIARSIEKNRPIETTFELVEVIKKALPAKVLSKKGHPAKQTFQAIRIEVNHELDSLEEALRDGLDLLNVGGRFCVITFHSLEDRMVKDVFRDASEAEKIDKRIPLRADQLPQANYRLVSKKAIVASEEELSENNRSHSAKLRVIERVKL
ncbi:MAG: 16S rRNA (cytosine(1402)-N(4))-methyltransferase RsmH [Erysipelotrichaceae bacterium]|nr:16S rRNA (cytosine(1402)-N(4))-methyltransferase RsmH [Erysipelotrichaceae bacterium]